MLAKGDQWKKVIKGDQWKKVIKSYSSLDYTFSHKSLLRGESKKDLSVYYISKKALRYFLLSLLALFQSDKTYNIGVNLWAINDNIIKGINSRRL